MNKKLAIVLIIFNLVSINLFAAKKGKEVAKKAVKKTEKEVNSIAVANQMMLVFMERMKTGNTDKAREVALQMIQGHKNFESKLNEEYKSFSSTFEKVLYELMQKRAGSKKFVRWAEQPISDGFYFLAMLDFQAGDHDKALTNLQRAIFWNPVRSAFYVERGFMLLKKKSGPDYLMAQIAYQKALELADNSEDFAAALRGLAFVFAERRRYDHALACLVVSQKFEPNNMDAEQEMVFIRKQAPALFTSLDSLAKAEQVLKKNKILHTFNPIHVQVLTKLADSYLASKKNKEAEALLKRALEMEPKNITVQNKLKQFSK